MTEPLLPENTRGHQLDEAIERIAKPFVLDEILFRLNSIAYLAKEMGHGEHEIPGQLEIIARIIRTYQPGDWIDAARVIEHTYERTQWVVYRNPDRPISAPLAQAFLLETETRMRESRSLVRLEVTLKELFLASSHSTTRTSSSSPPTYRTQAQHNAMKRIDPDYHPRGQ